MHGPEFGRRRWQCARNDVACDCPLEGPLSLGSVCAFKIKDNTKLDQTLGRLLTALEPLLEDDGLKIDEFVAAASEGIHLARRAGSAMLDAARLPRGRLCQSTREWTGDGQTRCRACRRSEAIG